MKVLVDVCVVPMGVGVSVSKYIVECEKIFAAAGLSHQLHAYGTNVEGDWDEVMAAIKKMPRSDPRYGCTANRYHDPARNAYRP